MKAVILAGGYGTRLSEETDIKPKPMVEIGGSPIIWHIMKLYAHYGINDFIICLGYKGYIIKEYFLNYYLHHADVTFDLKNNITNIHNSYAEPWRVTLVDTGENTLTGGRLKRIYKYLEKDSFCFTYGDGLSNVNIHKLVSFHKEKVKEGKIATLTAVMPQGRFGTLDINDANTVKKFVEKPVKDANYINGGFFVLEPEALNYVEGDDSSWEGDTINKICEEEKLAAYKHEGFWQPMDTLRDKHRLNELWENGPAPWKVW